MKDLYTLTQIPRVLTIGAVFFLAVGTMAQGAEQKMAMPKAMHGSHDMKGLSKASMSMSGMSRPMAMGMMRDPNAYSDGYTYETVPHPHEADEMAFVSLLADRFERYVGRNENAIAYDLQGWYGRDYDRLVFKAEGDVDHGSVQESRTELLWGHAWAPFWDTQLGTRYDAGTGPGQGWLALGIEGLAPYWFDVETTAYLGTSGQVALRFAASYELLLTQRLVLQPRLEANVFRRSDDRRERGAGLSDMTAGLRLRYEIRREFAPYLGLEWAGTFGGTASAIRAAGDDSKDLRLIAGLRFWF